MLRWVILVVAVVFLTGAATLIVQYLPESSPEPTSQVAVVSGDIKGPQPRIVLTEDQTFNFGKMPKHDKSSHAWPIQNTGEAPLEIRLQGKTTCSCTVAKPGENEALVIPPGGKDQIVLSWHTNKDLGEDLSQGGTFLTNDPRQPTFSLTVMGKVYPAVSIYPPEALQFPQISNEEAHSARIAIFSRDRPDLKVTGIATSKPGLLVADVKPMPEADAKQLKAEKAQVITVTIKPGMPLGRFDEEMVIHTDHPKEPEIKVSVLGHAFGPISVTPEGVRQMNVDGTRGFSRELVVTVRSDKGTRFEVVQKPSPLEISIAPNDDARHKGRYRMTVTVPPGTAPSKIEGEIVLKTNDQRAAEVRIPVKMLVTRSGAGG